MPLYGKDTRDHIIGYLLKDEMLSRMVDGQQSTQLHTLKRDIIAVPEDFPIIELFNKFLSTREHIALVVGEFGGMRGIVTMEDIIETLIGIEIVDESDKITDMQVLARRNWKRRAKKLGLIVESSNTSKLTDEIQPDIE
jgi:CBS domain containing-hemolysin-like protein